MSATYTTDRIAMYSPPKMKCKAVSSRTRFMMGPNDGVTTERPIETMSNKKNDSEFLAAFSAATINRVRMISSWNPREHTNKQESRGSGAAPVLVDISVVAMIGEHLHDQKDDGS
jgi:hypothetical protein